MRRALAVRLILATSAGGTDAARRAGRFGCHRCRPFMVGDGFLVSSADGSPYDAKTRFLARLSEATTADIHPAKRRPRRPWFALPNG